MAGLPRFTVGDHVHVASIGKGVVREVRNGGRYLVEVKGRHMVAVATQLTPDDFVKGRPASKAAQTPSDDPAVASSSQVVASIDLHGLTTDEALTALDAFLSEAILAGSGEGRVIHGRSGGRLKAAVHSRLKMVAAVRRFRLDPSNPGVTLVTF